MSARELHVHPTPEALAVAAADAVLAVLSAAIDARGRAFLALAGGSTPLPAYDLLAAAPRREALDWRRVEFLFGDERCVPPDHADSNYRRERERLLDPLGVAPERVHRVRGEWDPRAAADDYDARVRALLGHARLDLALLGFGADGHTASLFPGGAALGPTERLADAARAPAPPVERVTLTLPVFLDARHVLFLVSGADKAPALARVFGAEHDVVAQAGAAPDVARAGGERAGEPLPAARVLPRDGRCVWHADAAAAARLPRKGGP